MPGLPPTGAGCGALLLPCSSPLLRAISFTLRALFADWLDDAEIRGEREGRAEGLPGAPHPTKCFC